MLHKWCRHIWIAGILAFGILIPLFHAIENRTPSAAPREVKVALNVEGESEGLSSGDAVPCRLNQCAGNTVVAPTVRRIHFSALEQFMICLASFGLKPLYELVTLGLIWVIWKKSERPWPTLRWGLVAFFLGENACSVNYLFYGLENFTWEFWHCYGMLIAFGLITYALIEFVDDGVIHYSQKDVTCSFLRLCGDCYKYKTVACKLWLLFLFAIPAAIILCWMPLSAPLKDFTSIGMIYKSDILFTHAVVQQLYEVRVYPLLAMVFLAAAWFTLLIGKERALAPAKPLVAAGLGILGFSLMRFLLFWTYSDNILWAEVWEEITECLFIMAVLVVLNAKTLGRFGHRPPSPKAEHE